ncbi:MAG: diguanylate cyclase [Pseudomonadota bacterium]
MNNTGRERLLLILPVLLVSALLFAFDAPLGVAVPLTALSVLLPALVCLHALRQAVRSAAVPAHTESFIQRLIDVIPDPVFIKRAGGQYVMINQAFADYRGVDKATWKGFAASSAAPDDLQLRANSIAEDDAVLAGTDIEKEDHTRRRATGEEVFRIISKRRSIFVDGEPVVVGVEQHITRWKIAERELQAVLQRETAQRHRVEDFLQNLIDVIPHPVYVKTADGVYAMVNEAFAKYWSRSRESVVGLRSRDLSADAARAALSEEEDREVIAGAIVSKEQQSRNPVTGDEVFRVVNKRRCVAVDGSVVVIGIDHYITEWRVAERQLKQLAEVDALTGLANRRHFSVESRHALEYEQRYGMGLSLLLFDLDYFKRVNDQHGHNIGDDVLRAMAQRMQECFRKSDIPGRWGGEEFIALLPHTTMETAIQVAERLRLRVADTHVPTPQGTIQVTLSGGCAQWRAGDTLESLVERADTALYRAKKNGRNRIEVSEADDLPAATYATGGEV